MIPAPFVPRPDGLNPLPYAPHPKLELPTAEAQERREPRSSSDASADFLRRTYQLPGIHDQGFKAFRAGVEARVEGFGVRLFLLHRLAKCRVQYLAHI